MRQPNTRQEQAIQLQKIRRGIILGSTVIALIGIVLCGYGHAAINSDLHIAGDATVVRQEVALLDVPMNGVGEANPGFVPLPAPFTDAISGKNFSVTGTISHSTERVKVGKQSGYFSGAAPQRLSIANSTLNFGNNDFTISFWTYLETQNKLFPLFVSDSGNSQLQFFIADNNSGKRISLSSGADRWLKTDLYYTPGVWMHYAVVRKSNVFTIYQDGISIGTATNTRNIDMSSFAIGGNSSLNTPLIGYLDDIAVYDYAKWDANFTPPAEPQTDANLLYVDFEEESFDDTNYSDLPLLEKVTGTYLTPSGTGAIRGTEDGDASDGTALYLAGVAGQSLSLVSDGLNFGTQDFTVSFWAKPDKQTVTTPLIFGDSGAGLKFYLANNGASNRLSLYNGNTILVNTGQTYTANVWAHYAIVRCDGVFTIYRDGHAIGSTSAFRKLNVDLSNFVIGGISTVAASAYKGYLDEFVIYDQAIYARDFTPPVRAE